MYFDWSSQLPNVAENHSPPPNGMFLIPEAYARQLQPIYPLLMYPPYDALGPRPIVAFAVEGRS